jgi:RimJ/RimL family protein N-acetyltransferase
MSIMAINQRHARAEIGYWTAKSYWGRGFCTEAATAVLEYGFTALSLNRIQASVLPRNPASRRVLEKLGMQCEGLLRQYIRKHEIYEDLWMYSILVADWRMRRNGKSGGKLAG